MGSDNFMIRVLGKNPKDAFLKAVEEARYEYGNRGYTGTIAEKDSFVVIERPKCKDPHVFAEELMDNEDKRIDDKWGPAGCIDMTAKEKRMFKEAGLKWPRGMKCYLFFGWASS